MWRFASLGLGLGLGLLVMGCSPGTCGEVSLKGVAEDPEIEAYRKADGNIGLSDVCGTDYGAFASSRSDTKITTLVLTANVPDTDLEKDIAVNDVILPAASVVFWNANMVQGKTLTIANLAGSGLHKLTSGGTYSLFPLSGGTVTFEEGPNNHQEETLIDTTTWTEEWKVRWSLDFGDGMQHWEGEDTVKRSNGTEVGSEPFTPPDPPPS